MTINPSLNLVSNIGFGKESTHTLFENDIHANLKTFNLNRPFKSTKHREWLFEWIIFERFFNTKRRTLLKRVVLKILKISYRTL
jgi:hypothetical protein